MMLKNSSLRNPIPDSFTTIKELIDTDLAEKISLFHHSIRTHTSGFLLRSNIMHRRFTKLYLSIIPRRIGMLNNDQRRIQIGSEFSICLRQVLGTNQKQLKNIQTLILPLHLIELRALSAIYDFEPNTIISLPESIKTLFRISGENFKKHIKSVILTQPFKSYKHINELAGISPSAKIRLMKTFPYLETAIEECTYAEEKFGKFAVHPAKNVEIKLLNPTLQGFGEIIVTTKFPNPISLVNFRTGILGKQIFSRCVCKKKHTLILRNNETIELEEI